MSFFSFLSKSAGSLIDGVKSLVDEVSTTDEEKQQLTNNLTNMINQFVINLESVLNERHKTDMMSDSWLSKNIRPLLLLIAIIAIPFFAFIDGVFSGFQVDKKYLEILEIIIMAGIGFYYTGRTVEKVSDMVAKFKQKL